jgi:uncharacterized protein YjeT (DUF2065 family)
MGASLLLAVGLAMVMEGLLPFAAPSVWRGVFRQILELKDGQLRFIGLLSMAIGLLIAVFAL